MEDRLGHLLASQDKSAADSSVAGQSKGGSAGGSAKRVGEGRDDGPPQVFVQHAAALDRLTARMDQLVERLSSQTTALRPLLEGDVESWRTWSSYMVLPSTADVDCALGQEGRRDGHQEVAEKRAAGDSWIEREEAEQAEQEEASSESTQRKGLPETPARSVKAGHGMSRVSPSRSANTTTPGVGTPPSSVKHLHPAPADSESPFFSARSEAAAAVTDAAEEAQQGYRRGLGAEFAWAARYHLQHVRRSSP